MKWRLYERLTSPFKVFGFLGGLGYIIDQLLSRMSSNFRLYVYDFMVQPITGERLVPEKLTRNLSVRLINREDKQVALMPPPLSVKEMRFDQGAFCLGVFVEDKMQAYMWLKKGNYLEDEIRCQYMLEPEHQAVFDFDVFVFPENRMGLAFAALWDGANSYLYQQGIRYSFSRLNRFNTASKKAHDRLNWKRVSSSVTLKAWALEIFVSQARPFVSISFSNANIPELRLTAPP